MSSELSSDARKIISRWTKDGYYVYMSPTSSKWYWPKKKHIVYWHVRVEYRYAEWVIWEGKGPSLNDVILAMGVQIPRRKTIDPGFVPADKKGSEIGKLARVLPDAKRRDRVYFEIRTNKPKEPQEKKSKRSKWTDFEDTANEAAEEFARKEKRKKKVKR